LNFGFADPWHVFLPREPGHVIGLMGSGGKTTLMGLLADAYREEGVPVVLTTTTHTEPVSGFEPLEFSALPEVKELPERIFLHAGTGPDGKWLGLGPDQVDELGLLLPDRIVIAEVDGAAKMPVKLHRPGEPVWPRRTSLALVVMGTSAVGSKTGDVLHRFGRQPWLPLEDLKEWTVWEWDHALALLLEPGGYLSCVPDGVPAVLALTGMDEQQDSIGLFDFVGRAMADPRLPVVMFCDLGSDPPVVRTSFNEEDESRG
jgi:probable selenium-dependent hydroxylase accessory protein YqeC